MQLSTAPPDDLWFEFSDLGAAYVDLTTSCIGRETPSLGDGTFQPPWGRYSLTRWISVVISADAEWTEEIISGSLIRHDPRTRFSYTGDGLLYPHNLHCLT
jgi:hypothetical protein